MLAVPERVKASGGAETLVWHKPAADCNGECDFHAIACSDSEGIVMPWPMRDIPVNLDVPGERWCPDCLTLIESGEIRK